MTLLPIAGFLSLLLQDAAAPAQTAIRAPVTADADVYAFAYHNWNRANSGKLGSLSVGWHPAGGEKRFYLRFDLPRDLKAVQHAVLRLYFANSSGPGTAPWKLGIHQVTSSWREGAGEYHSGQDEKPAAPGELSWVQQPSFQPKPVATFTPPLKGPAWIEVDLSPLVNQWLSGAAPNHGIAVMLATPPNAREVNLWHLFASREDSDRNARAELLLHPSSGGGQPVGPGAVKGDLNGNGRVDLEDARQALRMSVRSIPPDPRADLDNDGGVTAHDARLLLEIAEPNR